MSLYGYKPKTKPALWTMMPNAAPKAPKVREARIRPVSKRRQKVTAEYLREAREFVRKLRGVPCPVVSTIPELRDGKRYGWPVSAKITEVHHTRGRVGGLLLEKRFWLGLSKAGHRWVHSNIEKARECGWICDKGLWNTEP